MGSNWNEFSGGMRYVTSIECSNLVYGTSWVVENRGSAGKRAIECSGKWGVAIRRIESIRWPKIEGKLELLEGVCKVTMPTKPSTVKYGARLPTKKRNVLFYMSPPFANHATSLKRHIQSTIPHPSLWYP